MPCFWLLRHGASEKNVASRHGGPGGSVTALGRDEMRAFSGFFTATGLPYPQLFVVERPQCIESGRILAEGLGAQKPKILSFSPYDLGIVDGLSDADVTEHYPSIASLMDRWRQGEAEIWELNIPGATDHLEYFALAKRTIEQISADLTSSDAVVIGTRSVLIALTSVLLGRSPVRGGGYREIPWRNGGFVRFTRIGSAWELHEASGVDLDWPASVVL